MVGSVNFGQNVTKILSRHLDNVSFAWLDTVMLTQGFGCLCLCKLCKNVAIVLSIVVFAVFDGCRNGLYDL